MAYLERIDHEWGMSRFRLCCSCGFCTDWTAVGFVDLKYCDSGHDSWLIAWYDARLRRLESRKFAMPLYAAGPAAEAWRDEQIVPQIREVHGSCFVSVPEKPIETDLLCPECQARNLIQQPAS